MYNSQQKQLKQQNNLEHCPQLPKDCNAKLRFSVYNGIPFCSRIEDHESWGAAVKKNGNVNFKIFTFADTNNVSVEIKKRGKNPEIFPLKNKSEGIFEATASKDIVKPGDRYRFIIEREGRPSKKVRDPYSMHQDNLSQWSIVYDHNQYNWKDSDWMNNRVPQKVSRKANPNNNLTPLSNLKIYEAHIGTLTDEGTFEAAKKELKKIAKDKKFNAVEFMPVENTFGINWGYDGVDKFAPNHTMGSPDKLKELIDYAHSLKLNVIMDIVPNHMGPDMSDLQNAGPYFDGNNGFGSKFNFECCNNKYVREYITNTALNWVKNYHCDGLRVDMTKFMESDFTMKQMAAEMHYHAPDAILIAEDGRDNDSRVTAPFTTQEVYENENEHCKFIDKIANNQVSLENLGFDTEWDFPFHKQIAAAVLGVWDHRIKNMDNLDYAFKNSGMRVKYPMSHDEIGNIDGTRLVTKIFANELKLNFNVDCGDESLNGQKAAHAGQNILKALLTGELDKMNNDERQAFYKKNYMSRFYTVNEIKHAYERSVKQHRLAIGKTYSAPGPKMIFQGDERANLSYFKFFRKFSIGYEKYLENKGYEPGEKAFMDSKLNSIKYCDKYKHYLEDTERYTTDLNTIMDENPALQSGKVVGTVVHPISNLHAAHCKKGNNEIFSISNFSHDYYYKNYGIQMPAGKWVEISNTDDTKYGGRGQFLNQEIISDGKHQVKLSIPEYGMLYFKKVG